MENNDLTALINQWKKIRQEFGTVIGRYEKEGSKHILDTWIQFSSDRAVAVILDEIRAKSDCTAEEIFRISGEFENSLEDVIRQLSEKTISAKGRAVFNALLQVMKSEKLHISTNYALMKDL